MKQLPWLVLLLCNGLIALAQDTGLNAPEGIALHGYDLVSYFRQEPSPGTEDFKTSYKGIVYQFSNDANLMEFIENPEKYLPKYGGWCAYAMGVNGEKVDVDPNTYKIIDGELYLFYNSLLNNTLKKWNRQEKSLLKQANKNWMLQNN